MLHNIKQSNIRTSLLCWVMRQAKAVHSVLDLIIVSLIYWHMSTHYLSDWYGCRRDGNSPKRLSVFSSRSEIIKSSLKSFVTMFFSFVVRWMAEIEAVLSEVTLKILSARFFSPAHGLTGWRLQSDGCKMWKLAVTIDLRFMPQVNGLLLFVWLSLLSPPQQREQLCSEWCCRVASSHHRQTEP